MEQTKNVVPWFEIYVNDMNRAKKFYSTVLGVELSDAPEDETVGEMNMAFFPWVENAPNAAGALVKAEGVKTEGVATVSTIVYFSCEDCSLEESRVEPAGGKVHKSKFSIGPYGYISLCIDTEGNTFGLHSQK